MVGFSLKSGRCGIWQGVVAPALGCIGLALAVVLSIINFAELTGATEGFATYLPWVVLIAAVIGLANGYLRHRKPSAR